MQTLGGEADKNRPLIVVDYAHTPDALEKVLLTLREVAAARGGPPALRIRLRWRSRCWQAPPDGRVAEKHADSVTVTSDNPRSEAPGAIIAAIVSGMASAANVEPDRAQAIRMTIATRQAADVVLLAGKGHEDYQEIKAQKLPFSDLARGSQGTGGARMMTVAFAVAALGGQRCARQRRAA